jgi:hypothetical protein
MDFSLLEPAEMIEPLQAIARRLLAGIGSPGRSEPVTELA